MPVDTTTGPRVARLPPAPSTTLTFVKPGLIGDPTAGEAGWRRIGMARGHGQCAGMSSVPRHRCPWDVDDPRDVVERVLAKVWLRGHAQGREWRLTFEAGRDVPLLARLAMDPLPRAPAARSRR